MTVSTTSAAVTLIGNGATTTFNFPFIGVGASNIEVSYTDTTGLVTVLTSSQYTLVINPPAAGSLWGVGGTVTYPTAGPPIANGTSLTITRILPITQTTSISNQGDFYPQTVEQALDVLCMEIQQVASRTGQFRGVWITNTLYNYADIVQDGVNGASTGNYYMCTVPNTSGVWATDLANGDWTIVINIRTIPSPAGGINGQIQYNNGGLLGGFTTGGDATINTSTGSLTIAAHAVTNAKLAQMPADTVKMNNTGSLANAVDATMSQFNAILGSVISVKQQVFGTSGTYTPSAGMTYCWVRAKAGGGGGGGCVGTTGQSSSAGGGGEGGYAEGVFTASQIVGTAQITIGAGGAGGIAGNNAGSTGGTTSVIANAGAGSTLLSTTGGLGGTGSNSNATATNFSPGGLGGTGSTGTYGNSGSPGQMGVFSGTFATAFSGAGGGTGGGNSVQGAGVSGVAHSGGGGSGASSPSGNTSFAGGAGGSGEVLIIEYCTQ